MAIELEAKVRVDDFAPVQRRLAELGARRTTYRLERNTYFDTADRKLLAGDQGLRIRSIAPLNELGVISDGPSSHVVTFKGPQVGEGLKQRKEIEFSVDDADSAVELLRKLGFVPYLGFEKRRE